MPKFVALLPVSQGCASFLHMLERHMQSLSLTDPGGLSGEQVMGRGEVLGTLGTHSGCLVGQLRGSALPGTEGLEPMIGNLVFILKVMGSGWKIMGNDGG